MSRSLYDLFAVPVREVAPPPSAEHGDPSGSPGIANAPSALIVGNRSDAHVQSVLRHVADSDAVACLDVTTLESGGWVWSDRLALGSEVDRTTPNRGWLRRMAPAGQHHLVVSGSLEAAIAHSQRELLAAMASAASGTAWLTDYWTAAQAENKLVQAEAARRAGAPMPETLVVAHRNDLASLGHRFVIKPLGVGLYHNDDIEYLVPAQVVSSDDAALDFLRSSPFIAQEVVDASRHYRIPTVGERAWPCAIDAAGIPFDWRWHGAEEWGRASGCGELEVLAVAVAKELGLGYSSQDWVEDARGDLWLLDVNPGGEWLFLEDDVVEEVSAAIASWLTPRRSLD